MKTSKTNRARPPSGPRKLPTKKVNLAVAAVAVADVGPIAPRQLVLNLRLTRTSRNSKRISLSPNWMTNRSKNQRAMRLLETKRVLKVAVPAVHDAPVADAVVVAVASVPHQHPPPWHASNPNSMTKRKMKSWKRTIPSSRIAIVSSSKKMSLRVSHDVVVVHLRGLPRCVPHTLTKKMTSRMKTTANRKPW